MSSIPCNITKELK